MKVYNANSITGSYSDAYEGPVTYIRAKPLHSWAGNMERELNIHDDEIEKLKQTVNSMTLAIQSYGVFMNYIATNHRDIYDNYLTVQLAKKRVTE